MPSEIRALEMSCGAEGIDAPVSSNWGAHFGRGFSTERPAVSGASGSSFVVGMAIKPVNLIVFVSDDISGSGSVGDACRTDLLAAVMRLLPKGDPIRVLNVGDGNFRQVFAKFRDRVGPDRCLFLDLQSSVDPAIEQLARALLKTEGMDDALVELYACAVGLAIATRFVSRDDGSHPFQPKRNSGALPKWRLKRVLAYIDANLGEPVALADLAAAAGLTRMHFAAQFRRATGIRPHEYLLRRRIERAQQFLSQSSLSIVDVAFSVGFQTQSHFTTVFKRFVGETPHQWRLSNGSETDLSLERDSRGPETRRLSSPADPWPF